MRYPAMLLSFLVVTLSSCQQSSQQQAPTPASSETVHTPQEEAKENDELNRQPEDQSPSESRDSTSTRQYYPVESERPEEVCGRAGFNYLATAYFFEECGGCHYEGNRFGVSNFAIRKDIDASYQVMLNQVNPDLLVEASIENAFCNSCLLRDDDPLLADIRYFADHRADSQCEN